MATGVSFVPVHEWVSLDDPDEDRTWIFDVTFLTSTWTCVYGRGCQGVLTEPAPDLLQGCCSHGAHFVDDDDVRRVEKAAESLGDAEWQFRGRALRKGITRTTKTGETMTRLVDGACILLNRPGFPTGAGCALHHAALATGRRPLDLKPDVCWQLPLRREDQVADDGHVTSTVGQWDRRHWGAGGQDFAWWCTEDPRAFAGTKPVYEQLAEELTAIAGKKVQRALRAYLEDRYRRARVPLPHPAVRRS
ncbi:MAG: hypothetical protein ACP5PM_03375 [Acidimicrobiales bacterium]